MYDWRVIALRTWIEQQEQNGQTVNMELLSKAGHLDNFHYLGHDSTDDILTFFQRTQGSSSSSGTSGGDSDSSGGSMMHLIEVGSGIGGPARYIAWKGNNSVSILGADIQEDLVAEASRVALKVGLGSSVLNFMAGDATAEAFTFPSPDEEAGVRTYDGFYSVLVFLHIRREPRLALFRKLAQEALDRDKGRFIIEDYAALHALHAEELDLLERIVGAVYIPTIDQYRRDLEEAGFTDIHFEDLTDVWTDFVLERQVLFAQNYDSFRQQVGERNAENMREFFDTVATVFQGGRLGGVRITGRVAGSGDNKKNDDAPFASSAGSSIGTTAKPG